MSLYWSANLDRLSTTFANLGRSRSSASRRKIRSALSVTWHVNQSCSMAQTARLNILNGCC